MNKTKPRILLLTLVIVLLAVPTFVVFAKELGSLTIAGPGIKGQLSLSDPKYMMKLEESGFFDQTALIKPPADLNLKAGYSISAQLNLDGKIVPFVEMVYYPTKADQPGYVHYTGRLHGETLKPVDEWSTLSLDADKAFRSLMVANNIALQSALVAASVEVEAPAASAAEPVVAPAVAPVAAPAPIQTPYLILSIVATFMLLVGAGLVIRRRTVNRTTT